MITNTGKNIVAKYLLSQVPAFASHLAFGCGAKPITRASSTILYRKLEDGLVTLTTQTPHGLYAGLDISVSGVSSSLDGIFTIKATPSTTTLTYSLSGVSNIPINTTTIAGNLAINYSDKESLDFEMFRVPITSRGYVYDENGSQIVFTAELPTEERYEITEIGVYPARSNPAARLNDSRVLVNFTEAENWEYHKSDGTESVPYIADPIEDIEDPQNPSIVLKTLQLNSNNPFFSNTARVERYESPRFLNRSYLLAGNISNLKNIATVASAVGNGTKITYTTTQPHSLFVGETISISGMTATSFNFVTTTVSAVINRTTFEITEPVTGTATGFGWVSGDNLVIYPDSEHIHLNGYSVNLNTNSVTDELAIAFSVINKTAASTAYPDNVKLILEFSSSDSSTTGEYARLEIDLDNGTGSQEDGQHDFVNNRYVVVRKKLQDLIKTQSFNWSNVQVIKIYASVTKSSSISGDYYVALDSLRFDNLSSVSPVYGLVGYSGIIDADGKTLVKDLNTNSITEFRFGLDVV